MVRHREVNGVESYERTLFSRQYKEGTIVKNNDIKGMKTARTHVLSQSIIAVSFGFLAGQVSMGAEAQETAGAVLEEVMVTARRTEERLVDVPVSISAFNSAALEERRILREFDLQVATPGLLSKQGMSSNYINYSLRGQSVGAYSYSPPAVVTYFNEVPVGGLSATSFFDLQSIQVLKGPQGTLFGRNTTGGAVLYTSHKPTDEFDFSLKGTVGNYDNREFEGMVNVPISDSLALRLSGRIQKRDGFQRNLLYNTEANSVDSDVIRLGISFAPVNSGFSNVLTLQDGNYGGKNGVQVMASAYGAAGAPTTFIDPGTGQVTPLDQTFAFVHGPNVAGPGASSNNPLVNALFNGIEDYIEKRASGNYGGFWDFYGDANEGDFGHDANHQMFSNITTWEVSPSLTIKNVLGYNELMSSDQLDIDGSPYTWIGKVGGPRPTVNGKSYRDGDVFGLENWSNEFQVVGEVGAVQYIAGIFYADETLYDYAPIEIAPDLVGFGWPGYLGAYGSDINSESTAIYGQLTWDASDRLSLSAGLRYTWEDVEITFQQGSNFLLNGFLPTSQKWDDPSWLLSATYDLTDDLMVYATQRGSWRAGGFNGTSGTNYPYGASFEPETTYDFEVGAKFAGLLGNVPTSMSVAVYRQWIQDVQRTIYLVLPTGPAATAGNVEEAEVTGVEIDAVFDFTSWLRVGATYAITDADYTDNRAFFARQTFFFDPYSDTPENSGSLYFMLKNEMAGVGSFSFRAEIYAQDSWYYANTADSNAPGTEIDGYELINVRAEWANIFDSKFNMAVFGRNLSEEEYFAGGNSNAATGGFNSVIPGEPRNYGVEFYYNY